MNISRPFVERPVATALLMVAVLLVGILAWRALPVSALPEVDYPTIQVYTNYPGSSPEVTASSITSPLERQLGQMAGLQRMDSTSSHGASVITLTFELSTQIDEAEQEVQGAINAANAYLPKNLPYPPVYSKVNPADPPILTLALLSDVTPLTRVQELAETRIAQKISQMSGVGLVTVSGGHRPAVKVSVDLPALNQHGLTLASVTSAIQAASVNGAKGSIDGATLSYAIGANDQLADADAFRDVVVEAQPGAVLRLRDVARVEEAAEDVRQAASYNGKPAILVSIQRQPGANVIATADRIRAALPTLGEGMPPSVRLDIINDRTGTIRSSVHEVQMELALAVVLVIGVIWLFLRDWRATLIPAITVPLSLVGTVAVAYALGFSLNNLTMMALTVATGFVVDDAIVMIENISRHIDEGEDPHEAALQGAGQFGFTIVSLSVALIAVMIPLLFMGDVVGRLFREFALTLSAAIVISAAITLTLTPMLCARLLRKTQGAHDARWLLWLEDGYARALDTSLRRRGLVLVMVVCATAATAGTLVVLPKGFFPTQDTGLLQGSLQAPVDSSFARMQKELADTTARILRDPAVASVSGSLGIDQTNATLSSAPLLVRLKPRGEGGEPADDVIARLTAARGDGQARLSLRPVQDLTLDSQGGAATYAVGLSSPDTEGLTTSTERLMAALRADPTFTHVHSAALERGPRAMLDIDRVSAARLGVTVQAVDDALYAAYGQQQVTTIYTDLSQYHVVVASGDTPKDPVTTLRNLYVPGGGGKPVPLSSFSRVTMDRSPVLVSREGQFPYADVTFELADGVALDRAVERIHSAYDRLRLPASVPLVMQGTLASFADGLGGQAALMLAAIIVVYLTLGALYESFIHPLTILSTLPPAALGAVVALGLTGQQFDIIAMIGIVLLVGIVMKNAIMMIDFAIELERERGMDPLRAIREACELRFRPIMMTTMASLLGAVPLAFGGGTGAELRHPLGVVIIGGLIVSQLLTLFSTPVIYLCLHKAETALARRL